MGVRDQKKDRVLQRLAVAGLLLGLFAGGLAAFTAPAKAQPMDKDPSGFAIIGPWDIPDLAEATLKALEKQRVFKVLFRHDPQAEAEMRAELEELAEDPGGGTYFDVVGQVARALVEDHVERRLDHASDAVIYAYLGLSLAVMDDLQDVENLCVDAFKGDIYLPDIEHLLTKPMNWATLYADVLESAATEPSPPPDPGDGRKFRELIADAYVATGSDADNLDLLAGVFRGQETGPEACRAIRTHLRVLLSMEEKDAAYVFKSMRVMRRTPAK